MMLETDQFIALYQRLYGDILVLEVLLEVQVIHKS